jgi:glycosyltransferase involved in cell wall biosynthesis
MKSRQQWTAILGKRDFPTDGVEDYCTFLGDVLLRHGIELKKTRVRWKEDGWLHALQQLRRQSLEWDGQWVIIQYTALAWSRRGFPFGAIAAIEILRRRRIRCAVMFHEPFRQSGVSNRWIDRVRGACQDWVVHRLYHEAEKSIFADPLESIDWLPQKDQKANFIPIGANVPDLPVEAGIANQNRKTIVIFCLSDAPNMCREVEDISHALNFGAKCGLKLRVVFLGRGTAEAKQEIERAFNQIPVEVFNLGLCPAEEISRILGKSDAMLCVRGKLFPRRGSALAGIIYGLPIVGYGGALKGGPIDEAGIDLVPYRDADALADALVNVLTNRAHWQEMHEKSLMAKQKYFSWDSIAAKFIETLAEGQSLYEDSSDYKTSQRKHGEEK